MSGAVHTVTVTNVLNGYREKMHRWSCSCGAVGEWKHRMGQARQGGTLHARRVKR